MSTAGDGIVFEMRHSEDKQLLMIATAWQLPPDSDALDFGAPAEGLNSHVVDFGIDECHPQRDSDILSTEGPINAPRSRASTWPGCISECPFFKSESEGDMKDQNRPFLSLMLPEWVHEKAAEDEATGASGCGSLVSFGDMSPRSSCVGSALSSCASSPVASPCVHLRKPRRRNTD